MQPSYESNVYVYVYFVIVFISCFYTLNFFLRFIMDSLQKAKICIYVSVTVFVTTLHLFPIVSCLTQTETFSPIHGNLTYKPDLSSMKCVVAMPSKCSNTMLGFLFILVCVDFTW